MNIPSSLAIWSLRGQFGFKNVGCCWMWVSQPSLIISFNAPSFTSKLLCSLIFCNILLQAERHQLPQFLCLVGYEWWGHMVATLAASAEDAEEELSGV